MKRQIWRHFSTVPPCRLFLLSSCFAVGLALPCCSGQAQSIVGHIATPVGVPIEGVRINGSQFGGIGRLTDLTDAAGNYTLTSSGGLSGTYIVTPTKSGYTFNPASSNVTFR